MLSRKFDIALSFAAEDRQRAVCLSHALARRGLTVVDDEWFGGETGINGFRPETPRVYLSARIFVPLLSGRHVAVRHPAFKSALTRDAARHRCRVLPVALEEGVELLVGANNRPLPYDPARTAQLADVIRGEADLETMPPPPIDAEPAVDERSILNTFVANTPRKPVAVDRYGIIRLLADEARAPFSEFRVRVAIEVAKYLRVEHAIKLGWPYDIWHRDGAVFLSTLPGFSMPYQTFEFVPENGGSAMRLKSIWTSEEAQYGRLDFHLWQSSVAELTANRVVPCLEREVTLRMLEQAGCAFGFPLTEGETEPRALCGWIGQLPSYDRTEWGCDPRLVAGKLGPAHCLAHRASAIAVYTLLLVGRWSAAAFAALEDALSINLPGRYRISVPGQGRTGLTVFLAETEKPDRGEAFLAQRRAFAALARMYAAMRGLPVPPADGSAALPPPAGEVAARFDDAVADLAGGDELPVATVGAADFETAPLRKLSDTVAGRALGFTQEPVLDLDSLITHRDILRHIQCHE